MVEQAFSNGEIIETYDTSEELRYLLFNDVLEGDEQELYYPIHIVAADQSIGRTIVITVYDPRTQSDRWSDDYKIRID